LAERVDFTGQVVREDLVGLLSSARVLVLPRPAGAFSQAGLPTKVGEYLASARPVVVTANGDIGLYLRDGVDAYLVPPDDLAAFGERLRYVLGHPDEATEVGRRGRQAAQMHFDPVVHGRRILEYVRELQESKALRHARRARLAGGRHRSLGADRPARERT
jgi:glycosyltransferase involved in cell wall biosynthesis